MKIIPIPIRMDRFSSWYTIGVCILYIGFAFYLAGNPDAVLVPNYSIASAISFPCLIGIILALRSLRRRSKADRHIKAEVGEPDPVANTILPKGPWSEKKIARNVLSQGLATNEAVLVCTGALPEVPRCNTEQPFLYPIVFTPYRSVGALLVFIVALWGAWFAIPFIGTPNAEMLQYRIGILILAALLSVGLILYLVVSSSFALFGGVS